MRPDIPGLPVTTIRRTRQIFIPDLALVIEILRLIGILQWTEIQEELVGVAVLGVKNVAAIVFYRLRPFYVEEIVEIEIVQQEEGAIVVGIIPDELVGDGRLWRDGFDGRVSVWQG